MTMLSRTLTESLAQGFLVQASLNDSIEKHISRYCHVPVSSSFYLKPADSPYQPDPIHR